MLAEWWCIKIDKFTPYAPGVGKQRADVSAAESFLLNGVENVSTVLEIAWKYGAG